MILTRRHPQLDDELFQRLMDSHQEAYTSGRRINNKGHQGVSACCINDRRYMIKHYRARSPLASGRLCLGWSRVDTSFRYANILNQHDVPAAKHLLVVKHVSPFSSRAYLIMEQAPGTAMFQFIQRDSQLTLSETAIENIAKLITGLHKLGIAHGDLHTRNLIIADDDSVRLIDFDNSRKSISGVKKDLERFRKAVTFTSTYEPALVAAMKRYGHPLLCG